MPDETLKTAEVTEQIPGKLVVSLKQPTPKWATWIFRAVFLLTTAATIIIAARNDIADNQKVLIMVYMKAFDVVIWGMGRGLGIKKQDFESEQS